MNNFPKIIKVYIGIVLPITFVLSGSLVAQDEAVAQLKSAINDVSKKEQSQDVWMQAKKGEFLGDGSEVKTGNKSLAVVLFGDGSGVLRVRENSVANIYSKKTNQIIDKNTIIQSGTVNFDVTKQDDNEEFKFTTPTVVASIRGTSGLIKVEQLAPDIEGQENINYRTTILLEEGNVVLESRVGEKATGSVSAGQTAVISNTGQIRVDNQTEQDKKDIQTAKMERTRKIKIQTSEGVFEIEYYPEEQ